MQFPKANSFPKTLVQSKIMGPNPLKLCEEMLSIADECVGYRAIPEGSVVLDLGSGTGITTAMLAREFGYTAYAADLWSNPSDNLRFFEQLGLINQQVIPMKVDASEGMPFAEGFFDAAVSTDSYHYFGRDAEFLDAKLLQQSKGAEILAIREMECTEEAWADWLQCENEYAQGDRAAIEAGAPDYLNSITIVLRKK